MKFFSFNTKTLSLLLYFLSLAFPAFISDRGDTYWGGELLLLGPLGLLLIQLGAIGWIVNPLYFITLFFSPLSKKPKLALWLCLLNLALAILSLPILAMFPVIVDEAGTNYFHATSIHVGFLFWLAAIVLAGVHAYLRTKKPENKS